MGCVFNYKGEEFETKAQLAEYILSEDNTSKEEVVDQDDVEEIERAASREKYDANFQAWYSKAMLTLGDDKIEDLLTDRDVPVPSTKESALEKSIKKMNEVFNVRVILDKSISSLGELLPANHALAVRHGKPVILINPNLASSETVFHEFSHLYVDLLGGSKNDAVRRAFELLKDTDMYNSIKEDYPELSDEMLNREVLANAIGVSADEIFGKEIVPMSAFNKVMNIIIEQLSKIFGIKNDAVLELAKQLTGKSKLQETKIENYNTTISQKQKLKVGATDFANVTKFIEEKLIPNEGYADAAQKSESKNERTGATKFVETYLHATNMRSNENKGDITLNFIKDDYNQDNIAILLTPYKIPFALDKALQGFFEERKMIDNKTNKTWDDVMNNENTLNMYKRFEERKANKNSLIANMRVENEDEEESVNSLELIIDNLDKILNKAEAIQAKLSRGAIAGQIVHDSVQFFVDEKDGTFGEDLIEKDSEFTGYIRKLILDGEASNSKFYTEVPIYDDLNKISGRIDLLEIKADGKFRIHDYKTTKSFVTKAGIQLNEYQLFFDKGHVSQLMLYGKILENYGMVASDNPFNLIATTVDHGDVNGTTDRRVVVSGLKTFSFNKSFRGNTGIKSRLFETSQKVNGVLRTRQATLKGDKENTVDYVNLIKRLGEDMAIYKRLTRKNLKNIPDKNLRAISDKFEEIQENKKYIESAKTRLSIDAFIEGVADQLSVLEKSIKEHAASNFDKDYMHSFKYMLQALEKLREIKLALERDSENEIGFLNKESKLFDVNALLSNIESSKTYYKRQVESHAAYQLANNSFYQKGLFQERFNIRLKKQGVTDKKEREAQVEELMREHSDEIFEAEMNYWKRQYSEGIMDLRVWEYQMADPGISKSQFVQVTKNLIDKSEMNKRNAIDRLMPRILDWNDNISYNKSGSTREIWKDFLEYREVDNVDGTKTRDLNGSVITEFTSDHREKMFTYLTQKEHYLDLLRAVQNKSKKTPGDAIEEENLKSIVNKLYENYKAQLEKDSKRKTYRELRTNPAFSTLSEEKKGDLRFIHKQLRDADNRVMNTKLKLISFIRNEAKEYSEKDIQNGVGEYIYNLPRQRMGHIEAANSLGQTVSNAYSRIKDIFRAPGDLEESSYADKVDSETEDIVENNEMTDKFNNSMSDLENNEVYDTPVFFRNSLGKDRALQSFDIPTLLAENHATTISYSESKMIEPDLFMISESLRISDAKLKVDSLFNGKVMGAYNRPRKSDEDYVYKAVKSQIDNRIYSRHYSGIYTKGSYTFAKTIGTLKKITSISTLTGNFMSALNTSGSGSVYRFLEGEVGEHFNRKDWANGTKKTYADMYEMLGDTQRVFPKSKTILLIRMLGMDHQYQALTNKFVQKNFASKNLDEAALFAVTSIAETNITAHLMYSLTGGIKMMNKSGEYIDKDGKVVEKENAMTFDEAYDVVDGVLELNKHVGYTSKDLGNKYSESGDINMVALTNISGYVKSVYADLFGQYDPGMKSVFETNPLGAAAASMKKWLPRGMHRRFRGITSQIAWGKNLLDFDQMREDGNEHLRFFSQDQQNFQEGYFVTALRYARLLAINARDTSSKMSMIEKNKELRDSMTEHEIANLGRAGRDIAYAITMYAIKTMLASLAASIGGDPKDKVKKERAYFAAYLALKLYHESASFMNPMAMFRTLTDPSVPSGQLMKISGLAWQLAGFSFDNEDNSLEFNMFETYKTGNKKDKSKAIDKFKSVAIPGYRNASMSLGIIGLDNDPDYKISDSYKYFVKANN